MDTKNINLQVDGDSILNLNRVIEDIKEMKYNLNAKEYLEALAIHLNYASYYNKKELLDAIQSKLLEFSNEELQKMNNLETLNAMQQYNADLKKLSVFSTKKEDNDSNKDIDYIAIRHDNGEVEMLVCGGQNTLNQYIQKHLQDVTTKSAEDIFHYFKEYIHENLIFYKEKDMDTLGYEMAKNAIVKEDDVLALEKEEVRKYAYRLGLVDEIKISIDPNGERFYMVGDAIIKFSFDYEHNRVMKVLLNPTIQPTYHLTSELNEEEEHEKTQIFDTEAITAAVVEEEEEEEEKVVQPIVEAFDAEKFNELLFKRDDLNSELTSEEQTYIQTSVRYLLDTMEARGENQELGSVDQACLEGYIDKLKSKEAEMLSEQDMAYIERYDHLVEIIKEKGLDKKPPVPKLESPKPNTNGIATVLMLVEIAIIGMVCIGILSLVMS